MPNVTLPHSINYTPDVIIVIVLAALVMYGLLLGRSKIKTLALSAYVGIVLATEFGNSLSSFLSGRHADLNGKLGNNLVPLILLVLPMLVLELTQHERHHRGSQRGGMVMTLILTVLTAALIISSGIGLLSHETQQTLLHGSALATGVYTLRLWWIALVPVAIVAENFIPRRD